MLSCVPSLWSKNTAEHREIKYSSVPISIGGGLCSPSKFQTHRHCWTSMASIQLYHLLLLCLLMLPFTASADDPIGYYCANPFANAGDTQARISTVLSDLVTHASVGGFATSSSGRAAATTIYGLAQCRADVSSQDCSACLQDAVKALPAECPHQADARIWYCWTSYSGIILKSIDELIKLLLRKKINL